MRNRPLLINLFLGLSTTSAWCGVTQFEGAHQAIHRVGRLVDLGKIEDKYVLNFKSVSLEVLPDAGAGQPKFKNTVQQVAPPDGNVKTLQILLDSDGKAVPNDFKELGGVSATDVPDWPDKLATEITEEALHVVDKLKKPEYQPFVDNLTSYSLSQITGPDGKPRGLVTLTASTTKDTLQVTMRLNATAESDPVVKK